MADVHQQVFERLKAPLLTLAAAGSAEPAYAVWAHLHLLVTRAPPLFAADFKSFFCRASDPPAVKRLKIEMLTAVADVSNTYDIVTELSEYVTDVDAAIARESVRAVGRVALDGDQSVAGIVERLLQFVDHGADYVTAETLIAVKDLTRRYPRWADVCVTAVSGIEVETIVEPAAKAALVYLYGEYGQAMPEAPYMLEPLLEGFEEEESADVRLELLTAAMKLFFKRAPEMRGMLGAALSAGVADANQDVHDRAAMYVRLLQHDPEAAARVVGCEKEAVSHFSDGAHATTERFADQIFDEFNTLSVLYRKPAYLFTDEHGAVARCRGRPPRSTCAPPRRTAAARRCRRIASSISATTRGRTPPAEASTSTIFSEGGAAAAPGTARGTARGQQRERELEQSPGSVGRADGGDGTGTHAWADDDSAAVFAPFAFARRRDVPGALGRVRAGARMRLGTHARRLGSACARRAHRAASAHDAPRRARIRGDGERGTTGCDEVFFFAAAADGRGLFLVGDGESFDSRGDGDDEVGRGRRAGRRSGETIDRGVRVVRGVTMTCSGAPIDRDVPHSRTDASFVVVGAISSPARRAHLSPSRASQVLRHLVQHLVQLRLELLLCAITPAAHVQQRPPARVRLHRPHLRVRQQRQEARHHQPRAIRVHPRHPGIGLELQPRASLHVLDHQPQTVHDDGSSGSRSTNPREGPRPAASASPRIENLSPRDSRRRVSPIGSRIRIRGRNVPHMRPWKLPWPSRFAMGSTSFSPSSSLTPDTAAFDPVPVSSGAGPACARRDGPRRLRDAQLHGGDLPVRLVHGDASLSQRDVDADGLALLFGARSRVHHGEVAEKLTHLSVGEVLDGEVVDAHAVRADAGNWRKRRAAAQARPDFEIPSPRAP